MQHSTKNSAKAIIIQHDKVLLIRKRYEDGSNIYTLPGGTQEPGELLEQALIREVFEETAAHIRALRLVHVYEHQRPSHKEEPLIKHKVEFAFLCELTSAYTPQNGLIPDSHQDSVDWMEIKELAKLALNPTRLASIINGLEVDEKPVYLGNIDH